MKHKHSIIKTQQAELGQGLVAIAEEKLRRDTQQAFQNEVNDVIRKISECKKTIALAEAGLQHFEAQRTALEAGEFQVHQWRNKISYHDNKLNQNYQDAAYPYFNPKA